jgi:hypothetical protein
LKPLPASAASAPVMFFPLKGLCLKSGKEGFFAQEIFVLPKKSASCPKNQFLPKNCSRP